MQSNHHLPRIQQRQCLLFSVLPMLNEALENFEVKLKRYLFKNAQQIKHISVLLESTSIFHTKNKQTRFYVKL